MKLGVANYLLKPFTQDDLVQRLTQYRSTRKERRPKALPDQAAIDQLLIRSDGGGRAEVLPKGLSQETADLVLAAVTGGGVELSAQECGDAVGISRVSARRYLEYFAGQGKVRVSLRYGAVGRPERRYSGPDVDSPPSPAP